MISRTNSEVTTITDLGATLDKTDSVSQKEETKETKDGKLSQFIKYYDSDFINSIAYISIIFSFKFLLS